MILYNMILIVVVRQIVIVHFDRICALFQNCHCRWKRNRDQIVEFKFTKLRSDLISKISFVDREISLKLVIVSSGVQADPFLDIRFKYCIQCMKCQLVIICEPFDPLVAESGVNTIARISAANRFAFE